MKTFGDNVKDHTTLARMHAEGVGVMDECGFSDAHEKERAVHMGAWAGHTFRALELVHDASQGSQMKEPVNTSTHVKCANCGGPIYIIEKTEKLGEDHYLVILKANWQPHVMCAIAMLQKLGAA